MFRKTTLLALAAVAAFGASVFISTSDAEAARPGSGARAGGGGIAARSPVVVRPGLVRPGLVRPGLVRPGLIRLPPRWPGPHVGHHCWRWPHHCRRPIVWYAPRPVYAGYSAAPVAGRCTCLVKEYTREGAVLFKDTCTNEVAQNPPAQDQQQQPQQQSYAPQMQPQQQQMPQAAYTPTYPPQTTPPVVQR